MGRRGGPTRLYTIIFNRVFLVSILTVIIGLAVISGTAFSRLIQEIGASRLDILRQIASQNQVIKSVSTSVTDDVYDVLASDYAAGMRDDAFRTAVRKTITDAQKTFDRYGMESSIDVVLGNADSRISSGRELREPLQQLLHSYWYMNLTSGQSGNGWSMRFLQSEESSSAVLSYGRVLRGGQGEPVCSIVVNTSQNMVFKNYVDALRSDNRLYIVDEQGIIVSHSNAALVGFALYHMDGAKTGMQPDGSQVEQRRGGRVLVTRYYDPMTRWTIVEELSIGSILASYEDVLLFAVAVLLLAVGTALLLSYVTARMIARPLLLLTARMEQFRDERLEIMPEQRQYYEVQALSRTFNRMIGRIRELVQEIKHEEREKRSIEFDFLQAQINPHFLHNTLFSIKSLIALGRYAQAEDMLGAFIGLLKMPIAADHKDHALHDEIEYIRHYITLMEYRYGMPFPLTVYMEAGMEEFRVPQLILQPLIENAIFHGLSEKEEDGCIVIVAGHSAGHIVLRVEDNGDGMTEEQVKRFWDPERRRSSLNGISLRNVQSRVQYVYGPESHIAIESTPGEGTAVTIVIVERKEEPS